MRTPLAGRMRLLRTHSVEIVRKEDGYYSRGEWVDGKEVNLPAKCNIQPFRQAQRRFLLPDGWREEHCVVVYSPEVKFKTSETHGQSVADTFEYEGHTFFVYSDQTWKGYGLSLTEHYAALACRSDVESILNGGE